MGFSLIKPYNNFWNFYYIVRSVIITIFGIWCLHKKNVYFYFDFYKTSAIVNVVIDILCMVMGVYKSTVVIIVYRKNCKRFKKDMKKINKFFEPKLRINTVTLKSVYFLQILHLIAIINYYFSYYDELFGSLLFIFDIARQHFNIALQLFVAQVLFYTESLRERCYTFNRLFEHLKHNNNQNQLTKLLDFVMWHQDIFNIFDHVTKVYGVQILLVVKILMFLLIVYVQNIINGSRNKIDTLFWIVFYLVRILIFLYK